MKKNSGKYGKSSEYEISKVKLASNITKKEIEKSYKIDVTQGTEAYYSNRYGWTLRKVSN
tara:strand:- start:166 stop:345 length:180 start_codon:yes stop_codon:yes gene_type:complete